MPGGSVAGHGSPDADLERPAAGDEAPLDAYSRVVIEVAERLAPSVANLRVSRRFRGRRVDGGGSGVVITPDGFMLTSAHVVERSRARRRLVRRTVASSTIEVVGTDPLSDLAVLRATESDGTCSSRPSSATRTRCASASSSSRSGTRTASAAR